MRMYAHVSVCPPTHTQSVWTQNTVISVKSDIFLLTVPAISRLRVAKLVRCIPLCVFNQLSHSWMFSTCKQSFHNHL